jgi:hypothetical protein
MRLKRSRQSTLGPPRRTLNIGSFKFKLTHAARRDRIVETLFLGHSLAAAPTAGTRDYAQD